MHAVQDWIVRKRDGRTVPFELPLIQNALTNAFRAELNLAERQPLDDEIASGIAELAQAVATEVADAAATTQGISVEKIQDFVELELMSRGHYRVARRYIVYRSEHAKIRAIRGETVVADDAATVRGPAQICSRYTQ